eukprot:9477008-Pyramimonas_sp.AAC.1
MSQSGATLSGAHGATPVGAPTGSIVVSRVSPRGRLPLLIIYLITKYQQGGPRACSPLASPKPSVET